MAKYLDSNGLTYFWGKIKAYVNNAVKVTGVKGNSESSYRTGNVNLTAANVGAVAKAGDSMTGKLTLLANQYDDATKQSALDCSNSNITNVNSIYTADKSDNAQEGIHFYRDSTHFDSVHAKDGVLYFTPNRALGSAGTSYPLYSDINRPTFPKALQGMSDAIARTLVDTTRANRFAFLPADQIIIEQTTDGGATWTDAGISDSVKAGLFAQTRAGINLPRINGARSENCGLRITVTAMKYNVPANTPETQKYSYWTTDNVLSQERYANLSEMYFWVGANGDLLRVKVECANASTPNTWMTGFDDSSFGLTGWSGNDFITVTSRVFGGGTNQQSQPWNWRITFFSKKSANGTFTQTGAQTIYEIRAYGATWWGGQNNMMKNDHLYSWDWQMNATFPAQLTATRFNGSATSLVDAGNSTAITAKYSGSGLSSASWLAAWNGYQIGAISPSNVKTGSSDKIICHDIRSEEKTPAWNDTSITGFFQSQNRPSMIDSWMSGIHVKGWSGAYNAWELVGPASNSDQRTLPLFVRAGNTSTGWGSWRKIYDELNKPTLSDIATGSDIVSAIGTTAVTNATNATNASKVNNLTVQTAVPANAVFTDTDTKVKQTSKTSGTYPLMLTGATSPTSGNATEANYNTNVKVDTSAGNLQATKFNGLTLTAASTGFTIAGGTTSKTLTVNNTYTLGAACAKGVDTSISSGSTSTNLPTTAAVASYVSSQASSDTKATQTGTNTSGSYPLLFKNTANTTDETAAVRYGNTSGKLVTVNPSSGNINASSFNGITITDDGADGIFIASAEGSIVVEGGNDFTLGTACAKDVGTVTSGNTGLVTGGDVYTAIQNAGGGGGRVATYYTTCSTAAGTAAKVITISGWTPASGDILGVRFSTANTAATPTLKVNGTTKSIYVGNATPNSTTNPLRWAANDMVYFQYDGTYFRYITKAPLKTCLYNNSTGTTDAVTLSVTAANFNFMRIYFKKSSGQNQCSSVDVFSPNQKYANLTVFEPDSGSSAMWFASRTVYINGTSISTYNSVGGQVSSSPSCGSSNEVAIYRVEAW